MIPMIRGVTSHWFYKVMQFSIAHKTLENYRKRGQDHSNLSSNSFLELHKEAHIQNCVVRTKSKETNKKIQQNER